MKAKVIKEFIDRHTRKFHSIGEEITLTDERFAEIEKAGRYVEMAGQGGTDEQPKTKKTRRNRKQSEDE